MRRPAIRSTAHDPILSYPTYQPGLSASYPRCQPPDFCSQLCTPKGVHNKEEERLYIRQTLNDIFLTSISYVQRLHPTQCCSLPTREPILRVNIASGDGLVPSGSKTLPEPMLITMYANTGIPHRTHGSRGGGGGGGGGAWPSFHGINMKYFYDTTVLGIQESRRTMGKIHSSGVKLIIRCNISTPCQPAR